MASGHHALCIADACGSQCDRVLPRVVTPITPRFHHAVGLTGADSSNPGASMSDRGAEREWMWMRLRPDAGRTP
jgi:hypothetical protein